MRNNYAPGSHDWFVPNSQLHLDTNVFNYISLFYDIGLLIILAYCLLPIATCIHVFLTKNVASAKVSFPNKCATIMHQAATTVVFALKT